MADITAEHFGPEWRCAIPGYVRIGYDIGFTELVAALNRWHAELVAAETPRKVARWDADQQGYALSDGKTFSTDVPWLKALGYEIEGGPEPIREEWPDGCDICEEAPCECEPEPAPEVVDVPQPEPWHARLVRLAQEAQAASKAHNDAVAALKRAEEAVDLAFNAQRQADAALVEATSCGALIRAATAPARRRAQAERPEPRYKVGDWVRAHDAPPWRIARADWWPERHCWRYSTARFGYDEGDLTPALDPALHETARRTVAWLRDPNGFNVALLDYAHRRIALPGYSQWSADHDDGADARWAAQLERLLGDA